MLNLKLDYMSLLQNYGTNEGRGRGAMSHLENDIRCLYRKPYYIHRISLQADMKLSTLGLGKLRCLAHVGQAAHCVSSGLQGPPKNFPRESLPLVESFASDLNGCMVMKAKRNM